MKIYPPIPPSGKDWKCLLVEMYYIYTFNLKYNLVSNDFLITKPENIL